MPAYSNKQGKLKTNVIISGFQQTKGIIHNIFFVFSDWFWFPMHGVFEYQKGGKRIILPLPES